MRVESVRMALRLVVLSLLLAGHSAGAYGQEPIRMGRYTVQLEANAKRMLKNRGGMAKALGADLNGYYYVVMQFSAIPDAEVQSALRRDGVQLHDYLGASAYYARVPSGARLKGLRKRHVVSIAPVKGVWKTADALVDDAVPEHARYGWGVRAVVHVWDGFDEAWVRERLQALNVVYSEFHFEEVFHTMRMVANRADLLRLAEEPWVKLVGLQGPASVLLEQGVGRPAGSADASDRLVPQVR